jgi:hypothetical protein
VDADLTLEDYPTMSDLASAIEALDPRLTCEVLDFTYTPSQLDEGEFDFDDDAAVNTAVSHTFHAHTAALKETVDLLVSSAIQMDLAGDRYRLIEETAGDSAAEPPQYEVLTGGTQSAPDATSYNDVFTDPVIIGKDFTSCAVESTSAAIHKKFQKYIEDSYAEQKERNGYVPAPLNQSVDTLLDVYVRPRSSERISVVAQGVKYVDSRGITVSKGPEDMAIFMLCMQGALGQAVPMTRKRPNIIDTVETYDRDSRKGQDAVAKRSILGVSLNAFNQLVVVRGLTTWRRDNFSQNVEISSRESIDTCVRDLRKFLTQELGTQVTNGKSNTLKALTIQRLDFVRGLGIIRDFANVQVSVANDTANISFEVAVVEPLNFIKVTATINNGL